MQDCAPYGIPPCIPLHCIALHCCYLLQFPAVTSCQFGGEDAEELEAEDEDAEDEDAEDEDEEDDAEVSDGRVTPPPRVCFLFVALHYCIVPINRHIPQGRGTPKSSPSKVCMLRNVCLVFLYLLKTVCVWARIIGRAAAAPAAAAAAAATFATAAAAAAADAAAAE